MGKRSWKPRGEEARVRVLTHITWLSVFWSLPDTLLFGVLCYPKTPPLLPHVLRGINLGFPEPTLFFLHVPLHFSHHPLNYLNSKFDAARKPRFCLFSDFLPLRVSVLRFHSSFSASDKIKYNVWYFHVPRQLDSTTEYRTC